MEDFSRKVVRMTLKQIAGLGKELMIFLAFFTDCFRRREGRDLLRVYVQGQLSDLRRKNAEAVALEFGVAPRTLQRFLESIKWDEERLRDRCQRIVAKEHAHADALGFIDESGVAKSGDDTVGVGRQWLGNRGKVDNGVVGVHISYSAPGFQCLLDGRLYLPEEWANDLERRKKTTCRTKSRFAPSHKSHWTWSIAAWPTVCVCAHGDSTNSTVAICCFSMVWTNASNASWARCRPIFTVGSTSRRCCKMAQNHTAAGPRNTHVWPAGVRPARSRIYCRTPPSSASSRGNGIASRTPTKALRFGRSSGQSFGARETM